MQQGGDSSIVIVAVPNGAGRTTADSPAGWRIREFRVEDVQVQAAFRDPADLSRHKGEVFGQPRPESRGD